MKPITPLSTIDNILNRPLGRLSDNPLNSTRSTMRNEYITGEESAKAIYYMMSLFMMIENRPQHYTTQ